MLGDSSGALMCRTISSAVPPPGAGVATIDSRMSAIWVVPSTFWAFTFTFWMDPAASRVVAARQSTRNQFARPRAPKPFGISFTE